MNSLLRSLFPQRIGRLAFGVRFLLLLAIIACLAVLLMQSGKLPAGAIDGRFLSLLIIVPLFALYFCAVLLPRVRDTGLHGGFVFLALVPGVNVIGLIALLFIPTDAFATPPNNV